MMQTGMVVIGTTLLILAGTLCVLPAVSGTEASWGIAQKPEPLEALIARIRSTGQREEPLKPADYDTLIGQIRQIGLGKQHARLKTLIEALHPDVLRAVESTAATRRGRFHLQAAVLMALGRLGNPESIAPLEHLKKHLDPYFRREMLPVVIARIHAESQIPIPASTAEWQEKASLFLSKAGLSLSEAIAALEIYGERSRTWPPDNLLEAPRGVIALRMLAEMAGEAFANGVLELAEPASSTYRLHLDLLLETLSVFESPKASQVLERLCRHPDSSISDAARTYLARKQRGEKPTFVSWL